MAAVERFVDTEANSGGNGTTRNHSSGDTTHAYDSFSAWESAEETDLVTDTDTHRVRCAGNTTVDTTAVDITGWTTDASFFITVQGDDAAPDNDGFYGGEKVWSTGHYRLSQGGGFTTLSASEHFTVIDGIQIECTKNSAFATCANIAAATGVVYKNCRITCAGNSGGGIFASSGSTFNSCKVFNNIVFDMGHIGIDVAASGGSTRVLDVYNNTVFDCGTGIEEGKDDADLTYNFFNNAVFNNTADMVLIDNLSTINHDWNAGEDDPPT